MEWLNCGYLPYLALSHFQDANCCVKMKSRGLLGCLPPELELTFYPYADDDDDTDVENSGMLQCISKRQVFPLESGGFTLFLFVDFANMHSIRALRVVSEWLHQAGSGREKVICVPNQSLHDLTIKTSYVRRASKQRPEILRGTGFFHFPITQKHRATLIRFLNVTCVPSIVVINNSNGRIASKLGWELICREHKVVERLIEKKKTACNCSDTDNDGFFCSKLLVEWQEGRSGFRTMPFWWWLSRWFI